MWTNETTLRLIDLYKNYRCLWDNTNEEYKNKIRKNNTWEEIASIMKMPSREVEMKIHGLRSQFIRERKKIKRAKEMGVPKRSTWFAYKALSFLVKRESSDQNETSDMAIKSDTLQDSLSNDSVFDNCQVNGTPVPEIDITQYEHTETRKIPMIIDTRTIEELPRTPIYTQQTELKKRTDEFDIYGQYVASELRNVKSEHAVIMAKYHINNIILKARMGKYNSNVDFSSNHGPSSQRLMDLLRQPYPRVARSSTATSMDVRDDSNLDVEIKYESEENR